MIYPLPLFVKKLISTHDGLWPENLLLENGSPASRKGSENNPFWRLSTAGFCVQINTRQEYAERVTVEGRDMNRRGIQLVVLLLVTALFAGSQCLASCLLAAEASPSPCCHQHSHSHPGKTDQHCGQQHPPYFSPEHTDDLEKSSFASTAGLPFPVTVSSAQALTSTFFHSWGSLGERGVSPGASIYLSLSTLRI